VHTHIKVVAVIFIVLSALGILGAVVMMTVFGVAAGAVGASGDPDARIALPIIGAVGTTLVIVTLVLSIPGLIAGFGLLKLKTWARILGIVLCALHLINVPIGTIFGIYGLWVLLNKETERIFRSAAPLNV
jgi:hypothetical protein